MDDLHQASDGRVLSVEDAPIPVLPKKPRGEDDKGRDPFPHAHRSRRQGGGPLVEELVNQGHEVVAAAQLLTKTSCQT